MADFERHPDDTDQLHLDLATEAVVQAKPVNRTYCFAMSDRIEIAFGLVRSLAGYSTNTERCFRANYHTALQLDFATAAALHHDLSVILESLAQEGKAKDAK